MSRSVAASLSALLILSACTESTAPNPVQQDLAPKYGKTVPPTPITVTGNLTWAKFDFAGKSLVPTTLTGLSAGLASISTGVLTGSGGASSDTPVPTFKQPNNYFMGRFQNTETVALLSVPSGGSKYDLSLDVYAIGSWDGMGKQAQGGAFGSNLFQVGAICASAPATVKDIFTTTFSNQSTVQQNYPLAYGSGGGAKALTNAIASNNLFVGDPTVPVPVFKSVSDATYHLAFTGTNPCGSGAFTVVFRSYSSSNTQTSFDETWGIDNITIKTDS